MKVPWSLPINEKRNISKKDRSVFSLALLKSISLYTSELSEFFGVSVVFLFVLSLSHSLSLCTSLCMCFECASLCVDVKVQCTFIVCVHVCVKWTLYELNVTHCSIGILK